MQLKKGRIECSELNETQSKIILKNNGAIYAGEFNEIGNQNLTSKIEKGDIVITSQGIFCKEFVEI